MRIDIDKIARYLLGICIAVNCTVILAYVFSRNTLDSRYIYISLYSITFLWLPGTLGIIFNNVWKFISGSRPEWQTLKYNLFFISLSFMSFCAILFYARLYVQ